MNGVLIIPTGINATIGGHAGDGIPVIAVKDNTTCLNDKMPDNFIIAEDYLSAAGIVMCLKAGIQSQYVTSNILSTIVIRK